jgi:hypothetical protein
MAPIERLHEAERRMRELLDSNGLPLPDDIEYGEECIRLLYHERKLVIIVEMDEDED